MLQSMNIDIFLCTDCLPIIDYISRFYKSVNMGRL